MVAPAFWEDAVRYLVARDMVMAGLVARYPASVLKPRGHAFETLTRAVVGQQISVKAAASIWGKLENYVGQVTPVHIRLLDVAVLRGLGLSAAKVSYIKGMADAFVDGVVRPAAWPHMSDHDVLAELMTLPGVGRWTAEMYLMFHLQRPNILPVGDLGLLKAFEKAYALRGLAKVSGSARVRKVTEHLRRRATLWDPYCSVATWYLWRSLDPVEVQY